MNWTVAHAGTSRNVIPADAAAAADLRVLRVAAGKLDRPVYGIAQTVPGGIEYSGNRQKSR